MSSSPHARPERLERPPIVEALIRFWNPAPVALEVLAPLHVRLAETHPDVREVLAHTGTVHFGDAPAFSQQSENRGSAFWSVDRRRVVQALVDGLAVSQLAPYSSWGELLLDFRSWWADYMHTTGSEQVARIGVRYINRMLLPVEGVGGDFLCSLPQIPPNLPQSFADVFSRVVVPYPDSTAVAITHAIDSDAGVQDGKVAVILDIDVTYAGPLNASSEELWRRLEMLHRIKNDVFFGCLTPAAWELFQ